MYKVKVNWVGSQFINHSLAIVNREICKRLIAEGTLDLGIIPYEEDPHFQITDEWKSIKKQYINHRYADITVRHQWPPQFQPPLSEKWVLIQPWEFGSIPRSWYIPMKHWVDEIWVHSHYNKECYIRSGIPEAKIKVIPHGVDETKFHDEVEPYELPIDKSFKFLFVGGTIQRKGIDILLEAYLKEFTAKDDVCLVIKDFCGSSAYQGMNLEKNIRELQSDERKPKIIYLNQELSSEEIAGLYKACDSLVHPFRGEGFGLPIIESMACGTPAIIPSIGPTQDFCDEGNAFFLDCEEQRWKERRIDHLVTKDYPWWNSIDCCEVQRVMRYAYENREALKQKGEQASKDILSKFTWKKTALAVSRRLQELHRDDNPEKLTDEEIIETEIGIGNFLFYQNAYEEAEIHFQAILDVYPHSTSTKYNLAVLYLMRNETLKALEHLLPISSLMENEPQSIQAEIWSLMGVCYFKISQYRKGIASFSKAIEMEKSHCFKYVFCLERAIASLEKKGQSVDDLIDLYHALGVSYFEMGNDPKAEETLLKAIKWSTNRIDIQQILKKVRARILLTKQIYLNRKTDMAEVMKKTNTEEGGDHFTKETLANYFSSNDKVMVIGSEAIQEKLHKCGVKTESISLTEWLDRGISHREESESFGGMVVEITTEYNYVLLYSFLNSCRKFLKDQGTVVLLGKNIVNTEVSEKWKELIISLVESAGFTVKEACASEEDKELFLVAQKNVYEVLWQSAIFNSSGYAEEQKQFLDSLRRYPLKIKVQPVEYQSKPELLPKELRSYLSSLQRNNLEFPLIHYQAAPAVYFTFPNAPISIGRTMFETDSVPASWVDMMKHLTEIWVPTEFNRETFALAGLDQERIFILPETLDEQKYSPLDVKPYPLKDVNSFRFLSIFDWSVRKGWDVLIRAYFEEFSSDDDVSLVLKLTKINEPYSNPEEEISKIARKIGKMKIPHIKIVDSYLTEREMIGLYAASDAFVMPSRGEGWGRPYMEAMAMTLPTIGTRWSGQLAFMNDQNSYLIDVEKLIPVDMNRMPVHFHGHRWAQPSVDHLKVLMRNVYENRKEAKQKGQKARTDLFPQFSRERIARSIFNRMDELVQRYYG